LFDFYDKINRQKTLVGNGKAGFVN